MVPESSDSQSFDRYSYSSNNPINYTDPTGHFQVCSNDDGEGGGCGNPTSGRKETNIRISTYTIGSILDKVGNSIGISNFSEGASTILSLGAVMLDSTAETADIYATGVVAYGVSIYTRKCTTHLQQHCTTESSATMYHFHDG